MGIVTTIPEKCKRCYTCVRDCPANAIKVEGGQAMVIEERCIACGNCVKVCAQKAKSIEDSRVAVKKMFSSGKRVFACLAPSFPAAFYPEQPQKVISAVKKLGFSDVWEVAFGAELISAEYTEFFKKSLRTGDTVISTPCPAIVSYILKYMPSIAESLAPIVSPMIAVAQAARHRYGSNNCIVFIGPCIAKKNEIRDPCVAGTVDAVLTYRELQSLFEEEQIDINLMEEANFDSPPCIIGRSFPISGGLLKTAGLSTDILENNILITEGKNRVLPALKELAEGKSEAHFFDVLFCEGCINGPKMIDNGSVFTRKQIIADFVNERGREVTQKEFLEALHEFRNLDLSRSFACEAVSLSKPTEAQIILALEKMKKRSSDDQLNCGACGYPTCRDKAIAVCQGLAESEMCLPYLVEELEIALEQIKQSHQELLSAQQRLVQSERLASMGQISAGVAHEINNPLGTIILYSHMLLKELQDKPVKSDLHMIVNEATRCKNIVRGLLDFSRQSRVSKTPTNLMNLICQVNTIMEQKAKSSNVYISYEVAEDLPVVMVDADQIEQMLVNLIQNGIDAINGAGAVNVTARLKESEDSVVIQISDNGCGISNENLSKLFTPFFTTKEISKGTGLGLSICYGIVKMHSGSISVVSKEEEGTTFTILLPVGNKDKEQNADEIFNTFSQSEGLKLSPIDEAHDNSS
ncbi:MAG: ATP-binding protein [Spirochaetota bacterium]|nr:MAG: ATP-binding protein [Spirochaetota bacterium]